MSHDLIDYYQSIKELLTVNESTDSKIRVQINKLNDNARYFNNDIIEELTDNPNLLDFINSQITIQTNVINIRLLKGYISSLKSKNKEANLIIKDFINITINLIKHQNTLYSLIEREVDDIKRKLGDIDDDYPDE